MSKLAGCSAERSSIEASIARNANPRSAATWRSRASISALMSTTVTRAPAAAYSALCRPPPLARHSTLSPAIDAPSQPAASTAAKRIGENPRLRAGRVNRAWPRDRASQALRLCSCGDAMRT